jgi:hypothetical protein
MTHIHYTSDTWRALWVVDASEAESAASTALLLGDWVSRSSEWVAERTCSPMSEESTGLWLVASAASESSESQATCGYSCQGLVAEVVTRYLPPPHKELAPSG